MSRAQIKDLPMLNRSPLALVTALAGVSNGRAGDSVINGQRTSFTNVTLDGINIQDNFIRTNAVDFSPNLLLLDQVSEMTISTSNTNPAFGNGASQVTFVTPSGTNQLPRRALRTEPQQLLRRQHLVQQPERRQEAVSQPEPARRQDRRTDQEGQAVLLREFRGLPAAPAVGGDAHHSDGGRAPTGSSPIPMRPACCRR